MEDNKLIDLHKVAGLFREIQEEEYAKNEAKEESEFKKTIKEVEETDNDSAVEEADETTDEAKEEAVEETKEEVSEDIVKVEETPVIAVVKDKPVAEEEVAEEEVTEQPEMVSMDTTTLSTLLNLAGLKPVTDADINQPQDGAEPVDEYSNSPDEQYADADTQLNKLSGGINRPKAMPTVGNDGHNRIVMKLKKSYDDME